MLLCTSRYPPRYIHSRFQKFFSSYFPTSFVSPVISNENDFNFIRDIILNKPTIPEYAIATRIAKSTDITTVENIDDPLVKARLHKQNKFDDNLIIHYTYEKRLKNNKKDIHQLWNQIFRTTPVPDTRLIIGNRNNRNLTMEIVHRH